MLGMEWQRTLLALLEGSQQCAFVSEKTRGILRCFRKSVASRFMVVILPLSPGEATPGEHCAQFWVSYYKRDLELLERVWWRTMKRISRLEHLS